MEPRTWEEPTHVALCMSAFGRTPFLGDVCTSVDLQVSLWRKRDRGRGPESGRTPGELAASQKGSRKRSKRKEAMQKASNFFLFRGRVEAHHSHGLRRSGREDFRFSSERWHAFLSKINRKGGSWIRRVFRTSVWLFIRFSP